MCRATFESMLGQFQVLRVLRETQCECCVVSVIVYVCVCVCVCGKPFCMPVRKSRWVFLCVSCVCVSRDNVFGYVRAVPSGDGSARNSVSAVL